MNNTRRYSTTRTTRTTNASRTNRTARTTTNTGWNTNNNNFSINSPKFKVVRTECQARIGSYRNVYAQFSGGTKTNFSPTIANRWMRYVNSGTRVFRFSSTDFGKYFGNAWNTGNVTAARAYLRRKFGAGIKDVTRGKGNCWLVATTKNVSGRPFNNYNWI